MRKLPAFEQGSFSVATLREIRRSGLRIVAVLAYEADTETVASLAQQEGMVAGFAWVLPQSWSSPVSDLLGWLWVRALLGSDMQTFAEQATYQLWQHISYGSKLFMATDKLWQQISYGNR